ncbi:hypothetical protein Hanom_Chr16g01477601 [Helianthus anomalus]
MWIRVSVKPSVNISQLVKQSTRVSGSTSFQSRFRFTFKFVFDFAYCYHHIIEFWKIKSTTCFVGIVQKQRKLCPFFVKIYETIRV